MNAPRRVTDLDDSDLDILISLVATRIHTINNHLSKHSFADKSSSVATHGKLELTLIKLKQMKNRERKS